MRICFCMNGPDMVNGPNVWLTRHLPLLRREGLSPEVLYLSWFPERRCRYRSSIEQAGFPVTSIRLSRFIEENTAAIGKAVLSQAPAIFVPNHSLPAYYACRGLRDAGIITVGTIHADDPFYHDLVARFVVGPKRWRLSAVVGVSDHLSTVFRTHPKGSVPHLHAPYGAPVPPAGARWDDSTLRLIYAGRLVERQKRIRRVCRGILAAAAAHPKVEGRIYGDGPELGAVEAMIRSASSRNRVRLGGLLDPDCVQEAMLEGHVFVLLSEFEGLSVALMEAMACGLVPIVARMRSGADDLIVPGENGYLVEGGDTNEFVSIVGRLAGDAGLWHRLSEAARRTIILRDYTPEACARSWARFLSTVTGSSESPQRPASAGAGAWELPPESRRRGGVRIEDRRSVRLHVQAARAEGRPVFLWGAGQAGWLFLDSVAGWGVEFSAFVDSDTGKHGRVLRGIAVVAPAHLVRAQREGRRPFVVITSQFLEEIERDLQFMGFAPVRDFVGG